MFFFFVFFGLIDGTKQSQKAQYLFHVSIRITFVLLLRLSFRNSYLLFKEVKKLMYLNNVNIALHEANYFLGRRKKTSHNWLFFFFFFFVSIGLPEIYKYTKDKGVTIPFTIGLNTLVKY